MDLIPLAGSGPDSFYNFHTETGHDINILYNPNTNQTEWHISVLRKAHKNVPKDLAVMRQGTRKYLLGSVYVRHKSDGRIPEGISGLNWYSVSDFQKMIEKGDPIAKGLAMSPGYVSSVGSADSVKYVAPIELQFYRTRIRK